MKFEILTEKEFKKFAYNNNQASFYQTINWGEVKEKTGWKSYLVGVKKDDNVIAASLILSKQTPIKKNMFFYLIIALNHSILYLLLQEQH